MSYEAKEDAMSASAADVWAYCRFCDRWFSCPRWFDKQAAPPLCPVCLSDPSAMENRSATVDATR